MTTELITVLGSKTDLAARREAIRSEGGMVVMTRPVKDGYRLTVSWLVAA